MWSSHATKRLVPYNGLHARQPYRAIILHTNGGGSDHGSLYGWWSSIAQQGQHIGAHFQIATSGHAEQYVDSSLVVYHAYNASEWAVGIETEDDSHPSTPWTSAQVATIVAICKELHVPARLLAPGPSDGIGWHEQYPAWNHDGHNCPGSVREQQIRTLILPALRVAPTPPTPPAKNGLIAMLIQRPDRPAVYAVLGGVRSWVPTEDVLKEQGFTFADVHEKPATSPLWKLPVIGPDAPVGQRA